MHEPALSTAPKDLIVTLPASESWTTYERELAAVADPGGENVMNYRVPSRPNTAPGQRCYVVWQGRVRGWMEIVGVHFWPDGFVCQTTGRPWPGGWYVSRRGPFHPFVQEMRGFQSYRYAPAAWRQGEPVPT